MRHRIHVVASEGGIRQDAGSLRMFEKKSLDNMGDRLRKTGNRVVWN